MSPILEEKRVEIEDLCRRYGVARLEVFGSAVEGPFSESSSDIDFLVEYRPDTVLGPWMTEYFRLKEDLERVVGRSVDLVMVGALKNPYFIREVNRTRRLLYAA
jgi:predicted nucleotidyltransferase